MNDNISQIKDRLNVVDVISGYIKVQKAGANYKARCPFHNEKTPSFYISPERQIWHCFGCGVGGDVFGFIKQIEGVEFGEALRILAQKAGVKLEKYDPAMQDAKTVIYEISETAARFFEKQLDHSPKGKHALAYLKERGLNDSTIKEFRLGYAPDGWHNLSSFLRSCGYQDSDIINSGLALKKEDGSDIYDRFRSRIIFPIADLNDRVVGFTGRIFDASIKYSASYQLSAPSLQHKKEEVIGPKAESNKPEAAIAKYINTPQTAIYDKGRILYGLNKAKLETRKADKCLLVEGNMDAIMSYQAGVKNVAATSGTALTPSHLQLLQRYTSNLDFCFDTDQAGFIATRRGIGLALSQNFNIKIVHLNDPDCKDPADYVKKFSQKWQETVKAAKPVIDFYFDKLKSELDIYSVEGKKVIISSLAPLIQRLNSQIEKSHWISKIAAAFKVSEKAVEHDILNAKDDLEVYSSGRNDENARDSQVPSQSVPLLAEDLLGEALLAVILKKPPLFSREIADIDLNAIVGGTVEIVRCLTREDLDNFMFNDFVKNLEEKKAMTVEFAKLKSEELFRDFSDSDLVSEFNNIKRQIEKRSIGAYLARLEIDIKAAESSEDKNMVRLLLSEFNDLSKKLADTN